jgi:hypothetical protein
MGFGYCVNGLRREHDRATMVHILGLDAHLIKSLQASQDTKLTIWERRVSW